MEVTQSAILLRAAVREFVRSFGLLASGQTPCGQALSGSEAHALMALLQAHQQKERLLLKNLCHILSLDKSNVSRLCRSLQAQGWIEILPCPDDGRARRLRLTASGAKRAKAVESSSLRRFGAIVQTLPDSSVPDVIASLNLLQVAIAESCATSQSVQKYS